MLFSHCVSLISSSGFPCFWWPSWFWGALAFWKMSHIPSAFCFFFFFPLMVRQRWAWGRNTTEVKCCLYHIIWRVQAMNALSLSINLDCACGWGLSAFSCVTLLSPLFHALLFGSRSQSSPGTQRMWISALSSQGRSIYISYLEFFYMGDLSLLSIYFYIIWQLLKLLS